MSFLSGMGRKLDAGLGDVPPFFQHTSNIQLRVDGGELICDERDKIFAALLDAVMIVTYFMSR